MAPPELLLTRPRPPPEQYQAPLAATRLAASLARLPDEARPRRTRLLFFAGSLDVCCTGAAIRCAIGPLFVATFGTDPDVLVRPTGRGACTRRALEGAANKTRAAGGDASAATDVTDGGSAVAAGGGTGSAAAVEASSYLERHGVEAALANALKQAVKAQPADPLASIGKALVAESLQRKSTTTISRKTDLGDSIMTAITIAPLAAGPYSFTKLGVLRKQEW